jgi:hypothetical protein
MAKEKEDSKGEVVSNGNKEISVLKKESTILSRILGEMKQELDVLTESVNAQEALEREEKIRCNDDI